MHSNTRTPRLLAATCGALALALAAGNALAISQSGEAQHMHRLGHTDLQGRSA
jgi:hypothetical protein